MYISFITASHKDNATVRKKQNKSYLMSYDK